MTKSRKILMTSLSTIAIAAALGVPGYYTGPLASYLTPSAALAESHEAGGQQNQNQGGEGGNQEQAGKPGSDDMSTDSDDEDSDGRGPEYGKPEDGDSAGGKPAWAQEGIPEVELGRLNVARSPESVLNRALDEAIGSIDDSMVDFYNLSIGEMIDALSLEFDDVSFIDSPLQNLALLKDALDGSSVLVDEGVTNTNDVLLAVFLGAASDKTVPISPDTVVAVTTILGIPVTGDSAVTLATAAEAIRIAILAGHG